MSRFYDGSFITVAALTNTGQFDNRYVNVTGDENVYGIKIYTSGIASQGNVPISEFSPFGYSGQIVASANRLYICVSGDGQTGQWKYTALVSNWS